MRRSSASLVAVLALSFGLMTAAAEASFPGKNGKLALSEFVNSDTEVTNLLYSVASDGSGLQLLNSYDSGLGRWSPSGTLIAFQSGIPTGCCYYMPNIGVANQDGSGYHEVLAT